MHICLRCMAGGTLSARSWKRDRKSWRSEPKEPSGFGQFHEAAASEDQKVILGHGVHAWRSSRVLVEQQNTQILQLSIGSKREMWNAGSISAIGSSFGGFCRSCWKDVRTQTCACCTILHAREPLIFQQVALAGGLNVEMSGCIPCHSWNSWTRSPTYSKITFLEDLKHVRREKQKKLACYLPQS